MQAIPAAIWAAGPSLPALPPEPMVMAEASALTMGTRCRIMPSRLWNAFITASCPEPFASGAKRKTIRPLSIPPAAVRKGRAQGLAAAEKAVAPSPAGSGGMNPAPSPSSIWVEIDKDQWKIMELSPAAIPISMLKTIHFLV